VTDQSHAVFLSYASQDAAAAQRICEALRAAGIEVWFDQSELRGGEVWDQKIRQQIRDCRLFVPVISVATHLRTEGYFRLEWKLAIDRSHLMAPDQTFLLPVVIDDTLHTDARIPERIRDMQWTRLAEGLPTPQFIARVRTLLADPNAVVAIPPPVSRESHPTTAGPFARSIAWLSPNYRRSALVALAVAILATCGAAYFALSRFTAARNVATQRSGTPTVAVLPFEDLSETRDQAYFAAGVAEQVTNLLAQSPALRVIGRSSAARVGAAGSDSQAIGAELGADFIVEGSVLRSGSRMRVSAKLLSAHDGQQRWSQSFDRTVDDVIAVQDAVAAELARALDVNMVGGFESHLSVTNSKAYDFYLRGLHALDLSSKADAEEAIAAFQQALAIEPKFAEAYVGLAMAYWYSGEQVWLAPTPSMEGARQAAQSALGLDPRLGSAHAALAEVHMLYDRDWAAAEREAAEALRLGAGAEGFKAEARVAAVRGDWNRATRALKAALAVDPLNPTLHWNLAYDVYRRAGRLAESEAEVRRVLEISPNFGSAYFELALALLLQGRLDEALVTIQKASPEDSRYEGLALVYYAMDRKAESDAALKAAVGLDATDWPYGIAEVCAFRHEPDQAMKWLEKAAASRDPTLYTITGDPLLKNLASDVRFQGFLRTMHLAE
jgi:TolB-like protein/Tfp pilus assembly protein PilF